jgi:hypothetical protein
MRYTITSWLVRKAILYIVIRWEICNFEFGDWLLYVGISMENLISIIYLIGLS